MREDFHKNIDKPNFNNYSTSWCFYYDANKMIVGKTKNETEGVQIVKSRGLKLKIYSYIKDDGTGDKKAKGTKISAIKNTIPNEGCKKEFIWNNQMKHKINL